MSSGSRRYGILALLLVLFVSLLPAVTIQSGGGGPANQAIVDGTPSALRVVIYDSRGQFSGQKISYSAATTAKTNTAAGTAPFFSICGSSTKTIRVQRVLISGSVATAGIIGDVELTKTSTATSSGTPSALTKVPHDSGSAAATASLVNFYTALATPGAAVGPINAQSVFFPITSATPALAPALVDFDYRGMLEVEAPVLRGTAQCLEASTGTTLGNVPTLSVSVVWTEE